MIQVLLFAQLQEEAGKNKLDIDEDEMELEQLKSWLTDKYHLHLDDVMMAVNEEYVEDNITVKSGDVVACIPPVSGG